MKGSILGAILLVLLSLTPAYGRSVGRIPKPPHQAKPHFAVVHTKRGRSR